MIIVKKHLFQYGDNQFHILQLKTKRHLQSRLKKKRLSHNKQIYLERTWRHSAGDLCELHLLILFFTRTWNLNDFNQKIALCIGSWPCVLGLFVKLQLLPLCWYEGYTQDDVDSYLCIEEESHSCPLESHSDWFPVEINRSEMIPIYGMTNKHRLKYYKSFHSETHASMNEHILH